MNEKTRELSMDEMDQVFAGARTPLPRKVGYIVYEVQRGDTLIRIANKYGTTKYKIKACNLQIKDDIIHTGDYIYIPEE